MAERSAPSVDVVIIDQLVMGSAIADGLFDTIDSSNVPGLAELEPAALDPPGYGPMVH